MNPVGIIIIFYFPAHENYLIKFGDFQQNYLVAQTLIRNFSQAAKHCRSEIKGIGRQHGHNYRNLVNLKVDIRYPPLSKANQQIAMLRSVGDFFPKVIYCLC